MTRRSRLRIGAVNYLNTKPLIYRLPELAPQFDLVLDLPSRLADDLAAERLDVALIPSLEFFQNPDYQPVSDACIGCRGPVLSVKLFFRKPPEQVRSLALDEGSRTSAALARILLRRRYGLTPELRTLPIGAAFDDTQADAVLLIGDRAMHSPPGPFAAVWDLGDQWCRWTELPFVFALWVARPGIEIHEVAWALRESRDQGLRNLPEIAAREASALGLTEPECLSYLRDNLYFYLGPREQRGWQQYYHWATELGLAPRGLNLGRYDVSTAG